MGCRGEVGGGGVEGRMIAIDKGKYLNMAEKVANATEINAVRNSRLFFLSPFSLLLKRQYLHHPSFTLSKFSKKE